MTPPLTGSWRKCDVCGVAFYARPSEDRKSQGGKRRYCTLACRAQAYRGDGNPKWRGGTYLSHGYVYVYTPDHPYATQDGYVREHRLVVERAIGRHLTAVEEVHHRNHIRDDNRLANLKLMADAHEHRMEHADYQADPCGTCATVVMRSAGHRRRWPRAFCSRRCAALAASQANAIAALTRVRVA